jgi:hypothetical protein
MPVTHTTWPYRSDVQVQCAMKSEFFIGIARIHLDKLSFHDALSKQHRAESEKATARLLSVFQLEGCQRLEENNFIDALISEGRLDSALATAGVTREQFRGEAILRTADEALELHPEHDIQCLNGLHRILAAKKFLDNNDQWWTVKLYREEGR